MLTGGDKLLLGPHEKPCEPGDLLLCFHGGNVLLCSPSKTLPSFALLAPFLAEAPAPVPLFCMDGRQVYALDTQAALLLPPESSLFYQPAGIFRTLPSQADALLLITAWHLIVWYRRNRFCGACGAAMTLSKTERALCCPSCRQTVYPTISPAVSVAITDQDRLLLARSAHATFTHFSLIAGYTEVGETLEETVAREVMEEVGLKVRNIRYIGSQAWGLSQSEMIGFHAELDGPDKITIQESELSDARWFHRQELTPDPDPASLSFTMIELFRQRKL